ncbi:MAG: aspartyl protease family protein [Planctomycetes bacterium]|nr:aspartyl protease family protein [Planctomycetota bacterium]
MDADLWNVREDLEVESGKRSPLRLRCMVDSGSTQTVLPLSVADQLDLPRRLSPLRVTYGDGRTETRQVATGLFMRIMGRFTETTAIVEPGRETVLVGAFPLEDMGFNVDLEHGTLVPYPGTEAGQCAVIE